MQARVRSAHRTCTCLNLKALCFTHLLRSLILESIPAVDRAVFNNIISITSDVNKYPSFSHVAGNCGDFGVRVYPFDRQFDTSNQACRRLSGLVHDIFYRWRLLG